MTKRILTGDRPTGPLHLGHYVGSLQNRVRLQHEYDTYILIADVQALTDNFEHPEKLDENVMRVALDYLAVGLDPEKVKFVIQSMVPELAELTIYFMNLVTVATLERNPTVKEEIKQRNFTRGVPVGFWSYPISQAADIAIFKADLVPVGDDQLPMIEQTREIVRRFNSLYGKVLVEPKAMVGQIARLPGTDGGAKMSKSLDNCIYLSDRRDTLRKRVMSMVTDPTRIRPTDPGHVENNPVFIYHDAFNPDKAEVEELKERYREGKVGDVEVKEKLLKALDGLLKPIHDRWMAYAAQPKEVQEILMDGTRKGRALAQATMEEVREALKIKYSFQIPQDIAQRADLPRPHSWLTVDKGLDSFIALCQICGVVASKSNGMVRVFLLKGDTFYQSDSFRSDPGSLPEDIMDPPCGKPRRPTDIARLEGLIKNNLTLFK